MLGDLFGGRAAPGEDDVKLFTKHGLVSSRMRSCVIGTLPFGGGLSRAADRLARPRAWRDGRLRSRIRGRGVIHSTPLSSCKIQKKKEPRHNQTPISSRM